MAVEDGIPQLPLELRLAMWREEMLAQGRSDAFQFAREQRGDVVKMQAEIEWYEDLIAHPTEAWVRPLAPNTSVRLHKDGYIPALKEAAQIVLNGKASAPSNGETLDNALPEHVADRLNYEQTIARGRSDAFRFAQKCFGHIGVLRAAIMESEAFIAQAEIPAKPDLSQRYSRRFYEEGYLTGLKDALKILLQTEPSQPQAVTRVAEPATNPYRITTKRKAGAAKRPFKKAGKARPGKQKGTR